MSRVELFIRFAVVAEELSFRKAGLRLGVDQPWLSRQIQQLEAELGFSLFARTTRRVELTEKGQQLYEEARHISASVERTMAVARLLDRAEKSVLIVGAQYYGFWVAARVELLNQYRAQYPSSELQIVSDYTSSLISKLRQRAVDVALLPGPLAPMPDLEPLKISQHVMRLLAPAEHGLNHGGAVGLSEMNGVTFVAFDPHFNEGLYQARYGQLLSAGALPVHVVDGEMAMYYTAKSRRLPIPAFDWPEGDLVLGDGFVQLAIGQGFPVVEHWLVRRRGDTSRNVERIWALAKGFNSHILEAEGGLADT